MSTPLDHARATTRPANVWLHRYCISLALCTLFLIMAGGMVTSTGSGLSVPDWPTTYGQNMFTYPPSKWVGGIFYEHTHRLIASTIGFMTIVLAVWMQRVEDRAWMRRLGWVALGAVILQGVLGGLTVKYLLPAPISVFHACLAQSFFCLTLAFAVFTSPRWKKAIAVVQTPRAFAVPGLCIAFTAAVFLQLVFGAIMRHTESGLAVPDFPLAYGQVIPDLSDSSLAKYNHDRRWDWQLEQITAEQIVYHMLHRGGAALVAVVVLTTSIVVLRRHGSMATFGVPATLALVLLAAQIALGAWTVWTGKSPRITTAHVVVGAALLADGVFLTLMSHRLLKVARAEVAAEGALTGVAA